MKEKKYYPNELKQEILNKVKSGTRVIEVATSYGSVPGFDSAVGSEAFNTQGWTVEKFSRVTVSNVVASLNNISRMGEPDVE